MVRVFLIVQRNDRKRRGNALPVTAKKRPNKMRKPDSYIRFPLIHIMSSDQLFGLDRLDLRPLAYILDSSYILDGADLDIVSLLLCEALYLD